MGSLLVEWTPILPIEQAVWADTTVDSVEALGNSWNVRFRQPQDGPADITILSYMTVDHNLLQKELLLDRKLHQLNITSGSRVILVACGISIPEIYWDDVKALAVHQGFHHGAPIEIIRSANAVSLNEALVTVLTQVLRLTGTDLLANDASAQVVPLPTEPDSFTLRRLDEI